MRTAAAAHVAFSLEVGARRDERCHALTVPFESRKHERSVAFLRSRARPRRRSVAAVYHRSKHAASANTMVQEQNRRCAEKAAELRSPYHMHTFLSGRSYVPEPGMGEPRTGWVVGSDTTDRWTTGANMLPPGGRVQTM